MISTIRPDKTFIIDVSSLIDGKSKDQSENFLIIIRDSMAHHIRENIQRNSIENKISSVRFAHHCGKDFTEDVTIDKLDSIIGRKHELVKKELCN